MTLLPTSLIAGLFVAAVAVTAIEANIVDAACLRVVMVSLGAGAIEADAFGVFVGGDFAAVTLTTLALALFLGGGLLGTTPSRCPLLFFLLIPTPLCRGMLTINCYRFIGGGVG